MHWTELHTRVEIYREASRAGARFAQALHFTYLPPSRTRTWYETAHKMLWDAMVSGDLQLMAQLACATPADTLPEGA